MIEFVKISGYRGIRDAELEDLGAVNLFIGPNGSGKTSILGSIFAFCSEGDPRILWNPAVYLESNSADGVKDALSWLFNHHNLDSHGNSIAISGQVGKQQRSVTINRTVPMAGLRKDGNGLDKASANHPLGQSISQDLNAIRESADLILGLTTDHGGAKSAGTLYLSTSRGIFHDTESPPPRLPATFIPALATRAQNGIPYTKMLDQAKISGRSEIIIKLLRVIDPKIKDVLIGVASDNSPVIRVDHQNLGICPLNVLGDGLTAIIQFALILNDPANKYIMFDEFDASLHVSALRGLVAYVKAMSERGIQLFLTTHRSDTVAAFVDLVEDGWDGLRVFQTRMDDGEVKAQSFKGDALKSLWRDLAIDLRVPS